MNINDTASWIRSSFIFYGDGDGMIAELFPEYLFGNGIADSGIKVVPVNNDPNNMLNVASKIGPIFKKLPWQEILNIISKLSTTFPRSSTSEPIKILNEQVIQLTQHINQITEEQTLLVDNVKILSSRLILLCWFSSVGFIISIIALILAILKR